MAQTTNIVVASVLPGKAANGPYYVTTNDGRHFKVWPELAKMLSPQLPYDVEYTEEDYQGKKSYTIRKINVLASARMAATNGASAQSQQVQPAAPTQVPDAKDIRISTLSVFSTLMNNIEKTAILPPRNMGELEEMLMNCWDMCNRRLRP